MVAEKFIPIEPDSEVGRFIMQANEQDIVTISHGLRFRIYRVTDEDLLAEDDSERVLQGLRESAGALSPDVDVEALKEDIRQQREQDSKGRPAT